MIKTYSQTHSAPVWNQL